MNLAWEVTKEVTPRIFKILLSIGKAIWRSTLSVLYLIVYSFLLFALLNYYELSASTIESFLNLLNVLVDNWKIFWWVFFASNVWDDWRFRK